MVAPLANAKMPDVEAKQTVLTYHDGAARIVYDTGVELPYPDGKIIVSSTDLEGIITHVNDAFVEISGYDAEELIGKPHYILRHPDMPKAAYKDLWDTAEANKKWHGYVKNLCKNGHYYWVYATVVPNVRRGKTVGYTSVRRQPSRSKIEAATAQYKEMIKEEQANS